ncbi:MAG: hypothetical protein DDG58_02505 [Ardenticatenia bacterium]|nr:MAG: hypothetical protein DDG58_02505 [Ardenticatenia bacterium]
MKFFSQISQPSMPLTSRQVEKAHQRIDLSARRDFWLMLLLFTAFRAMALLAFRPGGLVLDFSDFYWYREFAQLTRQGYYPYVNLWTTYPPLFPYLMIGVWWVSTLLPPWEFPNLWFTLLLGSVFLLFEVGNLVLLYAIAARMDDARDALRTVWFYGLLFVPVYTLTGWFESYPLFFFLLGLYWLLRGRPLWSAVASGLGFMIKLIPVVLLPIGLRTSRTEKRLVALPYLNFRFDPLHAALYLGAFVLTVILIGLPFYLLNPRLVWGSFVISNARAPWETVWALLEGRYDYGIIPLDMRDLSWQPTAAIGHLPWPLITLVFAAIFLFIYTRPVEWQQPRNVVAFAGFAVCLFMLYSKGYSPQWLGWVLVFIALLLPNLRGVFYAVVSSWVNLIEANIFFIIVPDEHWLLILTVGIRTLIFVMVGLECLFILFPAWFGKRVQRFWHHLVIGLVILLLISGVVAGVRFVHAYFDVRYQLSPYRATIEVLRAESQANMALILTSYDHRTYDWLYPFLRDRLTFYMLDDYTPPGDSVTARTQALMDEIVRHHRAAWFFDNNPKERSPSEQAMSKWLAGHAELESVRDIDGGRLHRFRFR